MVVANDLVRFCAAVWLVIAGLLVGPVGADDDTTEANAIQPAFVRSVVETTLKHYIEPPTRQQLIVDLLRYVSEKLDHKLSPELASEVSAIADIDELHQFLESQLTDCGFFTAENNSDLLMNALSASVGESCQLIARKEQMVNEQLAANRYVGIGIQVTTMNSEMKVTSVFPGGTSEAAGMKAGDVIESIDGVNTKNVPLQTLIQSLRGSKGTTVSLGVRDAGSGESRLIDIERKVVPFTTVKEMPADALPDDFRKFKILRITASTVNDLTTLVEQLPETVKTIVLDLTVAECTSTSIGLHNAHLLADALLDEGTLGTVSTRSNSRELQSEPGNVRRRREMIIVYQPNENSLVTWLAITLNGFGHLVYFNTDLPIVGLHRYALADVSMPIFTSGLGVRESVEVNDDYYVELMTSRLQLTKQAIGRKSFGQQTRDFDYLISRPKQSDAP